MGRFGDIVRIEARGNEFRVTLKSGTAFDMDRFSAADLADGVRVWDGRRGVVDLDEWRIRTFELLPTSRLGTAPDRLRGTVRTRQGHFTGFVHWDREKCVGTDELDGYTGDGELNLRFENIHSHPESEEEQWRMKAITRKYRTSQIRLETCIGQSNL